MLKEMIIVLILGVGFMVGIGAHFSCKSKKDFYEIEEIKNILNNKEFEQIKAEYEDAKKETERIKAEYNI